MLKNISTINVDSLYTLSTFIVEKNITSTFIVVLLSTLNVEKYIKNQHLLLYSFNIECWKSI